MSATLSPAPDVLVTGATGYIGRPLCAALAARGHRVRALVRAASIGKVAPGTEARAGNALDTGDVVDALPAGGTLVHLVGTAHPSPSKAVEFRSVDLASILASVAAARARDAHLVYVSVAQPAPVMRAYVAARAEGEAAIGAARLTATILRPWYVIGPGHRWPLVLVPLAALAERLPATRDTALRLGFVTLGQIVDALVRAVESRPARQTQRTLDVPAIRAAARAAAPAS
jgi:uncharacterized protein YbjT (DUF2867 family)